MPTVSELARLASLVLSLWALAARAQQPDAGAPVVEETSSLTPSSADGGYEWFVLPIVDGSTDIGVELGAFGALTKLAPAGARIPFRWSLIAGVAAAAKARPGGGLELPVHDDFVQLDWRSLDARWRLLADLSFSQSAVAGYYGIGNASSAIADARATSVRPTQYVRSEVLAQALVSWFAAKSLRVRGGLLGRVVAPRVYEGSVLALERDTEPLLLGLSTHGTVMAIAGLEFDTRDNEVAPTRGVYLSASLRGAPGPLTGNDLTFGGVNVHLRGYFEPWRARLVIAGRVLFDGVFGRAPLHELSRSGGFDSVWMLGGADGVRGVPEGRYFGKLRLIGNLEARFNAVAVTLFDTRFSLAVAAFIEGGRVWADWVSRPDLDGTGAGLHFGVGGGLHLRIGETIVLRYDMAYSPPPATRADAPFGAYVDYGQTF